MNDQAVYMFWQSIKDRLGISFPALVEYLKGWEVVPLVVDGDVVGGFAVKDGECHLGYGELPKSSIRKHMREVFKPALERFGMLKTGVLESNQKGLAFCLRMGFIESDRKNGVIYLQCERLNYV